MNDPSSCETSATIHALAPRMRTALESARADASNDMFWAKPTYVEHGSLLFALDCGSIAFSHYRFEKLLGLKAQDGIRIAMISAESPPLPLIDLAIGNGKSYDWHFDYTVAVSRRNEFFFTSLFEVGPSFELHDGKIVSRSKLPLTCSPETHPV